MAKINDLQKWRAELQMAEKFRQEEFGEYTRDKIQRAGYNIDYFERGFKDEVYQDLDENVITTINLFHAVIKNIVPALLFQNPRITSTPKKIESEGSAPLASATLNHYYSELDVERVNAQVVWDAYVLGMGVCKLGYATKFGADIQDKEKKKKSGVDRVLEAIGVKKKEEVEEVHPELNYNIVSESPYIRYVSPFRFGIDPRARTIEEAMYRYEIFTKTVKEMKDNKQYKNTGDLKGESVDANIPNSSFQKMSLTQIEDFKTVELYVVEYRSDDGIYDLIISKDGTEYREHYHEKNVYEIDGSQYETLTFNKHGHKLYPISDMTKIRNLQDRITTTIDAILEQVDRFSPKIAYEDGGVTVEGQIALRDGDIGALVKCTKDPSTVIKEISLTQYKADLKALVDQFIDLITIQTGLTRAQLTGVASGETATSETIAQGGHTLRITDMSSQTNSYLKKQATKLWDIVVQFVDLEELQLINGVSGIDPQTGLPRYSWLTVNDEMGSNLRSGAYEFNIEVGSTQKPDLAVIRKQFENLFSILARTDVIVLMQQQGKKVDLAELLRMYLQLFPEMVKDIGKIIQSITPDTNGLVPPEEPTGPGGTTNGSNFNALESMSGQRVPTMPNQIGAGANL